MGMKRRTFVAGALAAPFLSHAQAGAFADAFGRAAELDQLHALVIGQKGAILRAEAIRGPALGRPANVKSVSKSIVATLTGIAIDKGALPGVAAPLGSVAPGIIPRNADPRVAEIRVADLLTMQAGLERTSGANYGGWVSSRNWVADALSRPFVAEPGARMLYSTGSYHVMGAVLSEVTGTSLLGLARDWLGAPLGIEIPAWTRDPQGRYMGGNEMALTPEALWRFGDMIRQGGVWEGREVVSRDWVEAALTPRTRSAFSGHDYGYGWFLMTPDGVRVAYGRGYGGQMIYAVPELQLTVAITSDPLRPARSRGYAGALHALLKEAVLPEAAARL
ncbi:serine hydrolase domain-containing protein [Ovoidimarina sediminis]|uniref:serine hydrolase domain-containing protein n=1 Tax=Ovoidimarina sediminis TaxID=3079856 RepID=UPI00291028AE|nr:serine hydrolase [Rhodophyticola sp. MJ-SS7]MDU8946197.1 serine hydrolase [Rhodophyticola sp. MJ-SS7]